MSSLLNPATEANASGEICFSCTKCGRCCHDHNLPLTWDEAVSWLESGGQVDLYCEVDFVPGETPADDARSAHRKRRSFAAVSGPTRIRVTVIFVAAIVGPCRNLRSDLTCSIYETRPLVCRIYPAEINPFIQLDPTKKACPAEAWQTREIFSAEELAAQSRQTDEADAAQKDLLCRFLRIDVAAQHGDGFVKHSPHPKLLLQTLRNVRTANLQVYGQPAWRLFSERPAKLEYFTQTGAAVAAKTPADKYVFLTA